MVLSFLLLFFFFLGGGGRCSQVRDEDLNPNSPLQCQCPVKLQAHINYLISNLQCDKGF